MRGRAALLLVLLLSATVSQSALGSGRISFMLTETYVLENRGDSPIPLSEMDRAIGLFLNSSWQTVKIVEIDPPIERLVNDSDGNLYAVLEVPDRIDGGLNLTINVVYEVTSEDYGGPELVMEIARNRSQIPSELVSEYCASSRTWLTGDPVIRERAEEIAGNETKVLAIVEAFIDWIKSNISYSASEVPRYPNETLEGRMGDCDDQSILLITMCRILGIPAYFQLGYVLREEIKRDVTVCEGHVKSHTEGLGGHGWSVVYIPPWGWLPVDLTWVTEATGLIAEIEHAGIYKNYIILQQNISRYDYVGDDRRSREWIINSTLYIYYDGIAVQLSGDEAPPVYWLLLLPLLAGSSMILVFLYVRRRTRVSRETFYPQAQMRFSRRDYEHVEGD